MEEPSQGKAAMRKSTLWDCEAVVWVRVKVHLLVAPYLRFSHHFCFSQLH